MILEDRGQPGAITAVYLPDNGGWAKAVRVLSVYGNYIRFFHIAEELLEGKEEEELEEGEKETISHT